MKILVTGLNKNQGTENFYLGQQLKVVPSHYSLVRCLRDMGHTVDQKLPAVGEDLSSYDQAIVFLANPNSLTCSHMYNGLWAISQLPNCILAYDDWQIDSIYQGLSACADEATLFRDFFLGKEKDPDNIKAHASALKAAADIVAAKKNKVLMSVFAGGDLSLLTDHPKELLYGYNPNPYHLNRKPGQLGDVEGESFDDLDDLFGGPEPVVKARVFNFASLVQGKTRSWLKKQNVKWPIEFFGSKKDGQRRLTEGDMCKVYQEQWGCLMPGYFHAGSGWWRARPLQVADADSILIGDPKEMILYYHDDYLANLKAGDLEKMTDDELASTASAQKAALYAKHPLDKAVQRAELEKVLND